MSKSFPQVGDNLVSLPTMPQYGGRLTCRKPHFLVALGKFNIKIGDQGVDVVIALDLQAEGRRERQLFRLDCVNVHLL